MPSYEKAAAGWPLCSDMCTANDKQSRNGQLGDRTQKDPKPSQEPAGFGEKWDSGQTQWLLARKTRVSFVSEMEAQRDRGLLAHLRPLTGCSGHTPVQEQGWRRQRLQRGREEYLRLPLRSSVFATFCF